MTIEDINRLIASGEGRHLELKKTTGELKDAMHTACAFLNGEGGWLVFGITPTTLKPLGQVVSDNTKREIAQALSGIEPAADVHVEYVDVPDRQGSQVIAIYFDAFVWGHVPYTYNGRPYYKVESTTSAMPREMFEERLRASKPKYYAWERQTAENINISDLHEERIRGAVRLGVEGGRLPASTVTETLEHVLEKLQLLNDGVPNNAAVALFTTKIYGYSQFRIRMARFRGTDKLEFIDNQRAEGNFFDLLDAGMQFFFKHLSLSGKVVGLMREERLEIPVEALREALINALCHRQYEKYNLTIGIAIYDDRIEIESPGILVPPLTPENIKQPHLSYPYNPIIADALFRTTFLENWGSGAGRIVEACRKQNVPEPEWTTDGSFVVVTFKRPAARTGSDSSRAQVGPQDDPSRTQVGPKYDPGRDPVGSQWGPSRIPVQELIFSMSDKYMSINEMMLSFGMKSLKKFRKNYVTPALSEGAIEKKYPDNPSHPQQRYRLTEKAKAWKRHSSSKE